jgi:hypothetical protein
MPAIKYQLVFHRGEHRILLVFANNASWNNRIKAVAGARWSKTLRGWTIPDTPENRQKCGLPLQEEPFHVSLTPGYFVEVDQVISWQIDHLFCWRSVV